MNSHGEPPDWGQYVGKFRTRGILAALKSSGVLCYDVRRIVADISGECTVFISGIKLDLNLGSMCFRNVDNWSSIDKA